MTAGELAKAMTPANKDALLTGTASLLISVGCFAKPLGLSEALSAILPITGGIILLFVVRMRKKEKAERERSRQPASVAPLAARKKTFWLVALGLIAGSMIVLPLMPYTVENFQPWIYYWVIPAQIVFLVVFLTFFWRKLMRANAARPSDKAQE